MRIDLKKYLFAGPLSEKEPFFKKAQELGIVHFINMDTSIFKEVPQDVIQINKAIKVLLGLPTMQQEELEDYTPADELAHRINEMKLDLEKDAENVRLLKLEIERVRVYGNFSKEDIAYIEKEGKRKIQFFYAKQGFSKNPDLPDELIFIASDHNLDYFIAINSQETSYERMVEMKIDEPAPVLLAKLDALNAKIHATEKRLNTFSKYNKYLHKALINKLDNYHLDAAISSSQMEMDGELYFTEGFVPVDKMEEMRKLTSDLNVYAEEIAIEEEEQIPTYLENQGTSLVGEDLVHIYDTPSHTDKDPSLWVLLSFAIFFSMIIGDAGYGLVFLAVALYIRYKAGALQGLKKRMWSLLLILGAACVIWGTMAHSFFGIEMSVNSTFHKISILNYLAEKKANYYLTEKGETYEAYVKEFPKLKDAKTGAEALQYGVKEVHGVEKHELANKLNDGILMELALLVGIIHISFGFLRYLDRNWSGIGWILFMWGGYLYFPSYLKTISMANYVFGISVETAAQIGLILMPLGFGLACFLAILKHKLFGLLEIMNIIQVFGDILSYLRIYALALAGAIVTATINDFAFSTNIILGSLLFIVGHITNMALGIMGGVLHGLRLNFIEWYHYSFEGGGKVFNPLRKESNEN